MASSPNRKTAAQTALKCILHVLPLPLFIISLLIWLEIIASTSHLTFCIPIHLHSCLTMSITLPICNLLPEGWEVLCPSNCNSKDMRSISIDWFDSVNSFYLAHGLWLLKTRDIPIRSIECDSNKHLAHLYTHCISFRKVNSQTDDLRSYAKFHQNRHKYF